jgi:serpin B
VWNHGGPGRVEACVLDRRDVLRSALLAAADSGFGAPLAACRGPGADVGREVMAPDVRRALATPAALAAGASLVAAFGADLFRAVAGPAGGNLAVSPYSVAVALGMTRAGAVGRTAAETDAVLHASIVGGAPDGLPAALNALTTHIASLDGHSGITLRSANAVWAQPQDSWRAAFLTTLARYYGAGVRETDFAVDPARATSEINAWTSQQTRGKIPSLFPAGACDSLTRLVLVNALYLKAAWTTAFDPATPGRFTRLDGTLVTAEMMSGTVTQGGYATGPGWRAIGLPYQGDRLAMAVILPDPGRFAAVRAALDGSALHRLLLGFAPTGFGVRLPRFAFRAHTSLNVPLVMLGMPTAFSGAADFSGMTTTEPLRIGAVEHEAYVAVDEHGAEAAAGTGVAMEATAGIAAGLQVVVDRPFLFAVHDVATGTPLFLGQVLDPAAL